MIYFSYGTDTQTVKERSRGITKSLQAKKPDAHLIRFDAETVTGDALEECVGSQGLFERKFIVELSDVLADVKIRGEVSEWIEPIGASDNVFVWSEEKVDAKTLKKIEKHAVKVQEFNVAKKSFWGAGFNIFDLAKAFGEKDKKRMWVLLQEAYKNGMSPEEIHGTLHWQVRSILGVLSHPDLTAGELGMKPNVHTNAKRYGRNYTKETIAEHSRRMIQIYHGARMGGPPLNTSLEMWILGL